MERFVVGYIRGTHGLTGTLKVESASGKYGHLLCMDEVTLRQGSSERLYAVEAADMVSRTLLLKLAGVDSVDEARRLRGSELVLPREKASRLEEGEWYVSDLKGCSLIYGVADESAPAHGVGEITDVLEGGGGDLLEVFVAEGCNRPARKVLVPFNEEFIGDVDVARKTVQLMHLWILE